MDHPQWGDATARFAELVRGAEDYGVDELMVLTVCHDPRARLRSYELLADAFGLAGQRDHD